jgi:hypothetical protein
MHAIFLCLVMVAIDLLVSGEPRWKRIAIMALELTLMLSAALIG